METFNLDANIEWLICIQYRVCQSAGVEEKRISRYVLIKECLSLVQNRRLQTSPEEECGIAGVFLGLKGKRNRADVGDWSHRLGRRGGMAERLLGVRRECGSAHTSLSRVKLSWELGLIKMDEKQGWWRCVAPYALADSGLPWRILTRFMLCFARPLLRYREGKTTEGMSWKADGKQHASKMQAFYALLTPDLILSNAACNQVMLAHQWAVNDAPGWKNWTENRRGN